MPYVACVLTNMPPRRTLFAGSLAEGEGGEGGEGDEYRNMDM